MKAILAAGHDLGNHSENHKNMSQLSDEQCQEELMQVHDKVKALTGCEMFLFRPPYGDYDNHVIKNAAKCGYLTIQWDVDTYDIDITFCHWNYRFPRMTFEIISTLFVLSKPHKKNLKKFRKRVLTFLTRFVKFKELHLEGISNDSISL